ncbi:MAG TPA: hypothetical protein VJ846_03615 [Sphingomicrobium sp.]|nr:hypothetical protein [Sphingomicrobium sp.]
MATPKASNGAMPKSIWRQASWLFILITDLLFILWGGMAALAPGYLVGPRGMPILPAGYEGYTGEQWSQLASASPRTAEFASILFRLYGSYNVAFGILAVAITVTAFRRGEPWAWWALLIGNTIALGCAMTYDRFVNAVGPFEMLEYVGLIGIYAALFITAPMRGRSNHPGQTV